jgi:hypothetical protein
VDRKPTAEDVVRDDNAVEDPIALDIIESVGVCTLKRADAGALESDPAVVDRDRRARPYEGSEHAVRRHLGGKQSRRSGRLVGFDNPHVVW